MIAMAVFVGVLHIWLGVDLKFVLLLCALVAGAVAYSKGIRVSEMINVAGENVKKAFPGILILIAIGGIVGSWMYSGTVPYLIYVGLNWLHPSFVLASAFLVTAVVSTLTGTSWGSAATSGVAFMGIAGSMGIPLEMAAGAVLSGAFFGDKVSPVSDTTNVCAMASEITVYDHIKGMLLNVGLAGGITLLIFIVLGFTLPSTGGTNAEVDDIILKLDQMYNFNVFMLLPPLIVLVGGYMRGNPFVLMVSSSILAVFIGAISNGFSLNDGALSMISGFKMEMAASEAFDIETFPDTIKVLLNRGGFNDMMSGAVLFAVLAILFGSFMEASGALKRVMDGLLNGIKSTFGVIASAFGAGAFLNGVSGNAMFSILTVGQLFRVPFRERKIPLNVLSRSMENSMTLLECMLPWHVTAIYMTATLGVATVAYIPYAFFNIIGIILFFTLVGRDIRKKKY